MSSESAFSAKSFGQISLAFLVSTAILKKSYNIYSRARISNSRFQPRIVIIGSGMSGICAAVKLKTQLNYDNFIIYERDDNVGGTWYVNDYPGCQCDVPGLNYSLSFETVKAWTPLYYPSQAETWEYQKGICRKYKLYPHIQFNSCVTGMQYSESDKIWNITVKATDSDKVETVQSNIVISAVGILANKFVPKYTNMASFSNKQFHSSEWDHSYDFSNKKVAVIGVGPTAVQVIPALGNLNCRKLYVFQRSIGQLAPKVHATETSRNRWNKLFYIPWLQTVMRSYYSYRADTSTYAIIKSDSAAADKFEGMTEKFRTESFAENELLLAQTKPKCKPFGKRLLLSDVLFETFKQENCEIVCGEIERFTNEGIVTRNGREIELDCVVYCTGFKSQQFLASIENGVIGKNNKHLQRDVWGGNNCFAHLGITVSDFPNLFMLYGPGTNLTHHSVLFMVECAVNYTVQCIGKMIANCWSEIDVKESVMRDYVQELDKENEKNAWQDPNIDNWFKNDKGRGSTNFAWKCYYYWWLTRNVDWTQYRRSKL